MNAAHLHIILVHIPVILVPLGAVVLALGIWKSNMTLRVLAHTFFVAAGLVTVIAFLLGDGAEDLVENLAGVLESAIESHEEMAEVALWFSVTLGVVSLGILLALRFSRAVSLKLQFVVVMHAIVTSTLLGYSAQLGGRIRHPEAFEPSLSGRSHMENMETPHQKALEDSDD